jgi:hypothetical protein
MSDLPWVALVPRATHGFAGATPLALEFGFNFGGDERVAVFRGEDYVQINPGEGLRHAEKFIGLDGGSENKN